MRAGSTRTPASAQRVHSRHSIPVPAGGDLAVHRTLIDAQELSVGRHRFVSMSEEYDEVSPETPDENNLEPAECYGPEPPEQESVPTPLEARVCPDDCAAWSVEVLPGSMTTKVLALLEPARLSQAGRVDTLVGLDRVIAWASAAQHRVLAAMADDPFADAVAPKLEREWVSEDVRAALGESSLGAKARLRHAQELTGRLAATLRALSEGRITPRQADAIVDAVRHLDDEPARKVQEMVLPTRERMTDPVPAWSSFRRKLRRAVAAADPRASEQQHEDALAERTVWCEPDDHGMSFVGAQLPAEGAAAVMSAVDAHASGAPTGPADTRTKDQKRADALVQICLDSLERPSTAHVKIENDIPGSAPRFHGLRPAVNVSVALSTLLGLDEQPGQLDGYGTVPAALARRLAADPSGTWRRLVTDPVGRLVDYGRTTYRPPADLAQFVIARDRTCRAPGCTRAAVKSDLHHIVPFSRGGHTNAQNLVAACERNHYAIHDGGWQVARRSDDVIEWTSPTGHVYRVEPVTYPIDATHAKRDQPCEDQTDHSREHEQPPF